MKHTKFAHGIYYFGNTLEVEVILCEDSIVLVAGINHRSGKAELHRQSHPWTEPASIQSLVTAVALDCSSMISQAYEGLIQEYTPAPKPDGTLRDHHSAWRIPAAPLATP